MTNIKELSRVRQDQETGMWLVEVLSPVVGWIVQGIWHTKLDAEVDRKNWL